MTTNISAVVQITAPIDISAEVSTNETTLQAEVAQAGTGTGGIAAFVHNQPSPSATWTINHNLGYRPSVELIDAGSQEFNADVTHPTVNQAVINLSVATAGLARLL
jgi:tRNA A58 N-methylase Trm61